LIYLLDVYVLAYHLLVVQSEQYDHNRGLHESRYHSTQQDYLVMDRIQTDATPYLPYQPKAEEHALWFHYDDLWLNHKVLLKMRLKTDIILFFIDEMIDFFS